jgi:hypothetical protein
MAMNAVDVYLMGVNFSARGPRTRGSKIRDATNNNNGRSIRRRTSAGMSLVIVTLEHDTSP